MQIFKLILKHTIISVAWVTAPLLFILIAAYVGNKFGERVLLLSFAGLSVLFYSVISGISEYLDLNEIKKL